MYNKDTVTILILLLLRPYATIATTLLCFALPYLLNIFSKCKIVEIPLSKS